MGTLPRNVAKSQKPTLTVKPAQFHLGTTFGGRSAMELPGAPYFYALAGLSMAFVGFTSIVVVLREGTGKPLTAFQVLITRLFAELGLMATAFAMLAPTLAVSGMREPLVFQISSAIMLAVMVPWFVTYPIRRKVAAPDQRFPLRGYIMNFLGALAAIALFLNLVGSPIDPGPAPLAVTTVFVLSFAAVSFLDVYLFLTRVGFASHSFEDSASFR